MTIVDSFTTSSSSMFLALLSPHVSRDSTLNIYEITQIVSTMSNDASGNKATNSKLYKLPVEASNNVASSLSPVWTAL